MMWKCLPAQQIQQIQIQQIQPAADLKVFGHPTNISTFRCLPSIKTNHYQIQSIVMNVMIIIIGIIMSNCEYMPAIYFVWDADS